MGIESVIRGPEEFRAAAEMGGGEGCGLLSAERLRAGNPCRQELLP
jgi:hypothetical protein